MRRLVVTAVLMGALLTPASTMLLQGETDPHETEALIRRAREHGVGIILNLAPPYPIAPDALGAIDLLVVNEAEAAWLGEYLGRAGDAASLHAALGVGVVVTLGADGLLAVTAQGEIRLPGLAITPVDTTSAGDCFTGVLAAGLDRELTLQDALVRANAAAALCCTRPGTQGSMPVAAEIDAALS